jgi:hypothetical protein
MYKTLYTAGDGFCANHVWPMWSQILAEVLELDWENLSTEGIGNEAIANLVLGELAVDPDPTNSIYVIQWAPPERLDLRIVGKTSQETVMAIKQDPIYDKNFITTVDNKTYWCSSVSTTEIASNYRKFISQQQHQDRSILYMAAVAHALIKAKATWFFMFSYSSGWTNSPWLEFDNIIHHDMDSFSATSKYANLDVGEIQPVSSIHLDFLETYLLPRLSYNPTLLESIRKEINEHDNQRKQAGTYVPWNRNLGQRSRRFALG